LFQVHLGLSISVADLTKRVGGTAHSVYARQTVSDLAQANCKRWHKHESWAHATPATWWHASQTPRKRTLEHAEPSHDGTKTYYHPPRSLPAAATQRT